jgi:CxxC-x17-CxxC domain-containing protein
MTSGEKKKRNARERATPVVVKKPTRDEKPARRAPRGEAPASTSPSGAKFVGGPRNEHGTRIARRIKCSRCGKSDHVPFVPKDAARALCRDCAAEMLKTFEVGVKVRMPTKPAVCNLCGAPFDLPITAEDDGDPLCSNCLKGFTTWQGSVDKPFEERSQTVTEPSLGGTLVRKRKKS